MIVLARTNRKDLSARVLLTLEISFVLWLIRQLHFNAYFLREVRKRFLSQFSRFSLIAPAERSYGALRLVVRGI